MVIDRYPSSVKLLRSYGRFLEEVKNDPWTAARYFRCAAFQLDDCVAGNNSKFSERNNAWLRDHAASMAIVSLLRGERNHNDPAKDHCEH